MYFFFLHFTNIVHVKSNLSSQYKNNYIVAITFHDASLSYDGNIHILLQMQSLKLN